MPTPTPPNPARRIFFSLITVLLASHALAGPPVQPEDTCMKVTFQGPKPPPNGKDKAPYTYYFRKSHEFKFKDEGNPRSQMYSDEWCTERSNTHIFKRKDGSQHIHWVSDDPANSWNVVRPFSAVQWTVAEGHKITAVKEGEPEKPPTREQLEQVNGKPAETAPPVGDLSKEFDPKNPLATVAKLLEPADRHEHVTDRLHEFLWKPEHNFIGSARDNSAAEPASRAVLKEWITRVMSQAAMGEAERKALESIQKTTGARPVHIAALYYILGPGGTLPAWLDKESILGKALTDEKRQKRQLEVLRQCLYRWTASGAQSGAVEGCALGEQKIGALNGINPEWVFGFYTDAGYKAEGVVTGSIKPKEELRRDVDRHDEGVSATPGSGERKLPEGTYSKEFGVADLFGKWGDRNVFHLDGRMFAAVIRTEKTYVKGKDGKLKTEFKQQVGIYDISNKGDIFGRRFDLDYKDDKPFVMDDQNSKGKQYVLKLVPNNDGDIEIQFTRPDGKKPTYGQSGQENIPTVDQLFKARYEKAAASGNKVTMGGKVYRVSAESSDKGALTFWSEESLLRMRDPKFNARFMQPDSIAYVNHRTGGRTENLGEQVSIGKFGEEWHDLKWNNNLGVWDPVAGAEPPPDEDESKPPPGGDTGEGETPAPGPGGDVVGWPDEGLAAQGVVALPNFNNRLEAAVEKKVRFYKNTKAKDEWNILLLLDGAAKKDRGRMMPAIEGKVKILTPKDWDSSKSDKGHVLLLAGDKGGMGYYDLRKDVPLLKSRGDDGTEKARFDLDKIGVGSYDNAKKQFNDVTDVDALAHALVMIGLSEHVATIMERIKRRASDAAFKANGGSDPDNADERIVGIAVGDKAYRVWKEDKPADEGQDRQGHPGTKGIAMDNIKPINFDGKFPADIDGVKVANATAKAPKIALATESKTAAVYLASDPNHKGEEKDRKKVWIVFVQVQGKHGGKAVATKQIRFPAFMHPESETHYDFPGTDKLTVEGFDVELPKADAELGSETWHARVRVKDGKGIVAVYDGEAKGKSNTLKGLVGWWGFADKAKALEFARKEGDS